MTSRVCPGVPAPPPAPGAPGERLHLLSSLGTFVIRIRILMYPDVSCKDTCILTYPDVSQMYLTCSVTFEENMFALLYTYPKGVQDTFGIHIRYIRIHVSCALPWCHTGYISGYIRIRVSWTLLHDTSRYTEIQITIHAKHFQDT